MVNLNAFEYWQADQLLVGTAVNNTNWYDHWQADELYLVVIFGVQVFTPLTATGNGQAHDPTISRLPTPVVTSAGIVCIGTSSGSDSIRCYGSSTNADGCHSKGRSGRSNSLRSYGVSSS